MSAFSEVGEEFTIGTLTPTPRSLGDYMSMYYDWSRIETYDCPLKIVVSRRGLGKTFAKVKMVIEKFLTKGNKFIYVVETGEMVKELAKRFDINLEEDELLLMANKWEVRNGGLSGRSASQFIDYLRGTKQANS